MTKKRGAPKAHGGGGNPKQAHGHGGPILSATKRAALAELARRSEKAERDKKDRQLTAPVIRKLQKQGVIDKGATKQRKRSTTRHRLVLRFGLEFRFGFILGRQIN